MTFAKCLIRVNRTFDGNFQSLEPRRYVCRDYRKETIHTVRTTEIAWRLGAGIDCDESEAIVPNSFIGANGVTVVREDGFAYFRGAMEITDFPEDSPPVPLFTGRLQLIGRIGSHQSLGEACDEENHFEGWLEAVGVEKLKGFELHCVVVGAGVIFEGITTDTTVDRISGVLCRAAA